MADDHVFPDPGDGEPPGRDPFVYRGRLRARTGYELIKAMEAVRADLPRFRLPQLVIHPGRDRINPRRDSELVHEQTNPGDKTFTVVHHACHNILCEPERDETLAAIAAWLEARRG